MSSTSCNSATESSSRKKSARSLNRVGSEMSFRSIGVYSDMLLVSRKQEGAAYAVLCMILEISGLGPGPL